LMRLPLAFIPPAWQAARVIIADSALEAELRRRA